MSNSSDNSNSTLQPTFESYQGVMPKTKSNQGSIPLSQTGQHPRPQGSNTGITSEARPPLPPKTGK